MAKSTETTKRAAWWGILFLFVAVLAIWGARRAKARHKEVTAILAVVTNLSGAVRHHDQTAIVSLLHPAEQAGVVAIKEDLVKTFSEFRSGPPVYENRQVLFRRRPGEALLHRGNSYGADHGLGTWYVLGSAGGRWFLTLRVVSAVD